MAGVNYYENFGARETTSRIDGRAELAEKKIFTFREKKKLNKDLFDGQSDEPAKKKKTRKLLIVWLKVIFLMFPGRWWWFAYSTTSSGCEETLFFSKKKN